MDYDEIVKMLNYLMGGQVVLVDDGNVIARGTLVSIVGRGQFSVGGVRFSPTDVHEIDGVEIILIGGTSS